MRFWRDPALPRVEARSSTYTHKAFRTHTHRACIISLVEAGSTTYSLEHTRHTARAGHIVATKASHEGRRDAALRGRNPLYAARIPG